VGENTIEFNATIGTPSKEMKGANRIFCPDCPGRFWLCEEISDSGGASFDEQLCEQLSGCLAEKP
jgi:hypothetical protein